jgi:hypothetical protein
MLQHGPRKHSSTQTRALQRHLYSTSKYPNCEQHKSPINRHQLCPLTPPPPKPAAAQPAKSSTSSTKSQRSSYINPPLPCPPNQRRNLNITTEHPPRPPTTILLRLADRKWREPRSPCCTLSIVVLCHVAQSRCARYVDAEFPYQGEKCGYLRNGSADLCLWCRKSYSSCAKNTPRPLWTTTTMRA